MGDSWIRNIRDAGDILKRARNPAELELWAQTTTDAPGVVEVDSLRVFAAPAAP